MALIRFLNHSNLFVAVGAACLTAETFLANGLLLNPFAIAQSFYLVWCAYLFLKRQGENSGRWMVYAAATGLLLTGYFTSHWLLTVPAIVVAFYNPVWINEMGWKKRISLRNISWLKPMAIALCWTLVTGAIPLLNTGSVFGTDEILFCAQNFFFILSLAIAGDIRDEDIDRGIIRTLPTFIEPAWLKSVAGLVLLLSFFTGVIHSEILLPTEIISTTATILVFIFVFTRKPNWQLHTFLLDALLPVQLLVLLLSVK